MDQITYGWAMVLGDRNARNAPLTRAGWGYYMIVTAVVLVSGVLAMKDKPETTSRPIITKQPATHGR